MALSCCDRVHLELFVTNRSLRVVLIPVLLVLGFSAHAETAAPRNTFFFLYPLSQTEDLGFFAEEAERLKRMLDEDVLAFSDGELRYRRTSQGCGNEAVLHRQDRSQTIYWNFCNPQIPFDDPLATPSVIEGELLGKLGEDQRSVVVHLVRPTPGDTDQLTIAATELSIPSGFAPVVAAEAGLVIKSGRSLTEGLILVVRHGEFLFRYRFLSETYVAAGDTVDIGQTIAQSGFTGPISAPTFGLEFLRIEDSDDTNATIVFISL